MIKKLIFLLLFSPTILFAQQKTASWYGDNHHGKKMANGKIYNMYNLTCAAPPKYKFGTKIKVTNIDNNKYVIVTVTDRGGFYKRHEFDLSKEAFKTIAPLKQGIVRIKYEIIR